MPHPKPILLTEPILPLKAPITELKNWRLVSNRTGKDLFPGDEVDIARRGIPSEVVVITGYSPPHHEGQSGRVHIYYKDLGSSSYGSYYASVLHAHYEKVEQ